MDIMPIHSVKQKKDCFAYRNPTYDGCDALNILSCKYGNKPCPFYKPKSEVGKIEYREEKEL